MPTLDQALDIALQLPFEQQTILKAIASLDQPQSSCFAIQFCYDSHR